MAEVRPFRALHYEPSSVDSMGEVTAPPYDVIDEAERAELMARSPFNVVELDLPLSPREDGDPYAHAAELLEGWLMAGVLSQDREPTIWALTQDYTGPDGESRRRNSILARVRVTDYGPGQVRPHERTQPGPKQDRLDLTRATRYNLSPIFSLTTRNAWKHVEPATAAAPWAEVTDPDGTVHRLWPVDDPVIHDAVTDELAGAELLIADGHHRYETARTYRDEIGGEGAHEFTLMALTGLDDPGLTVFPTHRLLTDLDSAGLDRLRDGLEGSFEMTEVTGEGGLDPVAEEPTGCFGFADRTGARFMLRLRDPGILAGLMPDRSDAYRTLDAAILEKVVFEVMLDMSEADVEAKRGIGYAKTIGEALERLESDRADAAFLLRPTPIEQVRAVADAGETMPPKSTYFFPKLLSGMAFNPLS
jgi:uncharacterized protein (DUF1015 family)